MKKNDLTNENLKQVLWETLVAVKAKKISPAVANATNSAAREIIRVVNTELSFYKLTGQKPTSKQMLVSK